MTSQDSKKKQAAEAALAHLPKDGIIGVGTGSTVNFFIKALADIKHKIEGAVASSKATEAQLKAVGIQIQNLNNVSDLPVYIDGADEYNLNHYLIKGGGGALTGEKIIASAAKKFICIVDESKESAVLGNHPIAIEVIPMARSFVARKIVALGGNPVYRAGFVTDYGNVILDAQFFNIVDPVELEDKLNTIPGVVCNGIFAHRKADILLIGTDEGVKSI